MRTIFVIAKNTYRAAIRDRIVHGIIAFAFVFIAFTLFLGSISLGEDIIIIRSFGMAGIYFFSLIATIFLGASLLYTEMERRTIYLILAKPVSSGELILGKFFGLLAAIVLIIAVMAVLYCGIVASQGGGLDTGALLAIAMQIV